MFRQATQLLIMHFLHIFLSIIFWYRYSAKQGDMVEEVSLKDEQTDRRIFVLSDMHFGSSWTSNNIDRLHIFTKLLAKCAKQHLHTLVLLGDIFDMWGTPINKRPQTKEAMSLRWMDEKVRYSVVS